MFCSINSTTYLLCTALEGVECTGAREFTVLQDCIWTSVLLISSSHCSRNGYTFEVALLLSIFLGFCGVDRCYLGYPAVGVAKLLTFGGFAIGALLDIVMISTQVSFKSYFYDKY